MSRPLRVLLVEDSDDDAELVLRELKRGGFDVRFERVQARDPFCAALRREPWDVIISDYQLPRYSGLAALRDLREADFDLPFILVSGTIGEVVAVEAMQAGANDYVLKNQLVRLCAAVDREVRAAALRAEQRRMREQLIISDRMASAGTLAAGVAHEINNPLAVVISNLDFVCNVLAETRAFEGGRERPPAWGRWLEDKLGEADEPLRDAQEAVTRIRDIVRDVKLFSRPNDERDRVEVERVLDSSLRMAWNEIRHRAQVVREYGATPPVDVNEARLGQVLLNLIVNAAQAIPEGDAKRNEIRVSTRLSADRDRVVVDIRDTGTGISADVLGRIFEPFFTTKPLGLGTGLGLAICHRLVTDMGGEITVQSEPGKGTHFCVSLPVAARDPRPETVMSQSPPARRARILLVDDEEPLARAIKRSLSRYHDVFILTSGREAVDRIAQGERFDVILSDLMMPEVTGMDLYREVLRAAPDQAARIVFLTGGAFTARARSFLDEVSNPRIEKPVEMANLLAVVAGVVS